MFLSISLTCFLILFFHHRSCCSLPFPFFLPIRSATTLAPTKIRRLVSLISLVFILLMTSLTSFSLSLTFLRYSYLKFTPSNSSGYSSLFLNISKIFLFSLSISPSSSQVIAVDSSPISSLSTNCSSLSL